MSEMVVIEQRPETWPEVRVWCSCGHDEVVPEVQSVHDRRASEAAAAHQANHEEPSR